MVHARHYVVVGSNLAVIMIDSSAGRFDAPTSDLYPRLSAWLKLHEITALRVALCDPENPECSIHDVQVGVQYLCGLGSKTVILIGYEHGADAVWNAATEESCVRAIALLAPKKTAFENPDGRSLLVWHEPDRKPALNSSSDVRLIEASKDSLDARADEIFETLRNWIQRLQESEGRQAA